ncbi:MAG: hypothetical protein CMJ49_03225 [Planctomycetaceae bacterium]|nr:hypothetical protein [Planctomycetaceae bacterium]
MAQDPSDSVPARHRPWTIITALLAAAVLVAADLALKNWAQINLTDNRVQPLIPKLLAMRWVENHGAIFGIAQGQRLFFIAATIIATAAITWIFVRAPVRHRFLQVALVLILAGALGNLHDRVWHQFVRDMLWLFPQVPLPFNWHWPGGSNELYPWIFNLADVYLVIGIAILIIRSIFIKPPAPADPN